VECSGFHGRDAVEIVRGKCRVADMDDRLRDLVCYGLREAEEIE
jgi:hypothetical protein